MEILVWKCEGNCFRKICLKKLSSYGVVSHQLLGYFRMDFVCKTTNVLGSHQGEEGWFF